MSPWLSDDVSAGEMLEQLLPLLKQGSHWHPQRLGQEHRVRLARHVGGAPALHLPDEPPGTPDLFESCGMLQPFARLACSTLSPNTAPHCRARGADLHSDLRRISLLGNSVNRPF